MAGGELGSKLEASGIGIRKRVVATEPLRGKRPTVNWLLAVWEGFEIGESNSRSLVFSSFEGGQWIMIYVLSLISLACLMNLLTILYYFISLVSTEMPFWFCHTPAI